MSVEVKKNEEIMLKIKDKGDLKVKVVEVGRNFLGGGFGPFTVSADRDVLEEGDLLRVEYAGGSEEERYQQIGFDLELEVTEVNDEFVVAKVRDIEGSDVVDEGSEVRIT